MTANHGPSRVPGVRRHDCRREIRMDRSECAWCEDAAYFCNTCGKAMCHDASREPTSARLSDVEASDAPAEGSDAGKATGGVGADVLTLLNGRGAIVRALDGYDCGTLPSMAEAIQSDPGPLLAALAEAGVLSGERRALDDGWVTSLTRDDVPEVRVKPATIQRRYVSKWAADA